MEIRDVHFWEHFTPSRCTSPFGENVTNKNGYLVAQNPQNSTLVAANSLDWRGYDPIASWPILIPFGRGLNCWNFFIGKVVKCFMADGETGGVRRWPWVIKIAEDASMLSRINGENSWKWSTVWLLYFSTLQRLLKPRLSLVLSLSNYYDFSQWTKFERIFLFLRNVPFSGECSIFVCLKNNYN